MGKGNVEQIMLREFREEQNKNYIIKFKEDDVDEYDTYEMFHYYLAAVENERRNKYSFCEGHGAQYFECHGEDNRCSEKSSTTLHAQKND